MLLSRINFNMPLYYVASIIVSTGGLLFGLDTGTIGPITAMSTFVQSFGNMSPTKHGAIVSTILIPAATSSLFAGNIADSYGRSTTIIAGGAIFGIGATLEAAAPKLAVFIFGRVIKGLGEGLFLATVTTYICEISPTRRRGPIAALAQFAVTIGVALGYFISFGTSRLGATSLSWRLPCAWQALVAFSMALACLKVPPSPRWLISKGRHAEAQATLNKLGLASSEIEELIPSTAAAAESIPQGGVIANAKRQFRGFAAVFSKEARKQTSLSCFMMIMMQFCGIDGVLFYAPTLFQKAGLASEQASFLASGVSALAMFVVTVPAMILQDHWGRRMSAVTGGTILSTCMLLIGSLYAAGAVHGDSGAARWVVIVAIYVFAIGFSMTWAIGFRIYANEIQPTSTRASAANLANSVNWLANWIVAFTTPILLSKSSFGVYFFFGFCSLLCLTVCLFAMPETKGRSLETIEQSFKLPASGWSLSKLRRRRFAQAVGVRGQWTNPTAPEDIELECVTSSAMRPMVLRTSV
jgi:sugar porter (SP) family MFS transporter